MGRINSFVDPTRYEQFGWRATVAAVRAARCSLDTPASVALCWRLLDRADRMAVKHIDRTTDCPVRRYEITRHLDCVIRDDRRPLVGRLAWAYCRQEAQRGDVRKGKDLHYYTERHRLLRQPRDERVRYYAIVNSHRMKPYQPRWTGQVVDLTGGRYDEASVVYAGSMAKCNPWYDEVDQGYREQGHDEAAANDW
jgi:hypothetical protein